MKKSYQKPIASVECFQTNIGVAYCTNQYTTKTWDKQTVDCVISSSDNIFGSDNCNESGYTVVDSGSLTYIEGEGYFFIWSKSNDWDNNGDWNAMQELSGESGLKKILTAAGIENVNQVWQNYHAGPVTEKTVDKQNWSL